VYRALQDGTLTVGGDTYRFRHGQEIVFQCRMSRDAPPLNGPLLIGNFKPTNKTRLCGSMGGAMKGKSGGPAGPYPIFTGSLHILYEKLVFSQCLSAPGGDTSLRRFWSDADKSAQCKEQRPCVVETPFEIFSA